MNRAKKKIVIYTQDDDNTLEDLLNWIKNTGNAGCSFSVVVKPNSNNSKEFYWDGDGADFIEKIDVDATNSPTELQESPQSDAALKQIVRLAKTIGFPQTEDIQQNRIFWNRERGMRGKNTIDRIINNCQVNKWVKGGGTNHGNDQGSFNTVSFTDPTHRFRIVFNTVNGNTPEENKYSMELKHIGVNESKKLIDKILSEALKTNK